MASRMQVASTLGCQGIYEYPYGGALTDFAVDHFQQLILQLPLGFFHEMHVCAPLVYACHHGTYIIWL